MRISWASLCSILLLQILTLVSGQINDPAEFKHELPPGVELVNPKDFGLTDEQLGGLLSNVKVLGGSQIGDTKTQILTVGFEGDENLNFDDFDIPGLTDRKPADIPDKDKEIASVAFEKFKEFFKDPKKAAQNYQPTNGGGTEPQNRPNSNPPPEVKVNFPPQPKHHQNANNPPQQLPPQRQRPPQNTAPPGHQYHHRVRTSQETLQQHYPVQLTQPQSQTTSRTIPTSSQRNPHQRQNSQENLNNHRTEQNPPQNPYHPQFQSTLQAPPPPPLRQSSHAIAFANNNQPTTNFNEEEFGTKLSPTPNYNQIQTQHKQYASAHQNQVNQRQEEKVQVVHQHEQTYSTLPPGNFQRFTLFSQPKGQGQPTSPPPPPPQRSNRPQGQVVRNQLLFTNNNNNNFKDNQNSHQSHPLQTQRPPEPYNEPHIQGVVPPHEDPQEYRTINQDQYPRPPPPAPPPLQSHPIAMDNPSPSPSSSVPSTVSLFPPPFPSKPNPHQRPVSHVFIQQGGQGSPSVQQTSFHPSFQAPTSFSNDFTPSVNRITTPVPHFEVTPSMPMILLSTNENAITDPKRMELLRKHQKTMEEKRRQLKQQQQQTSTNKERQPHALNYNNQQQQQQQQQQPQLHFNNNNHNSFQNHNQITETPRKPQNYNSNSPQNTYTQTQYRQQYSSNSNSNHQNNNNNGNSKQQQYQSHQQNSFNFQTQSQNHQLHTLQQNLYFNSQSHPPRTYYQAQQQQLAQGSTNYASVPIGIQPPPPPPNFHPQFYGGRQKRGYRQRLTHILRGLWGDRD